MTPKDWKEDRFVPGTRAISIGGGIVYRPLRSWHSGVYAGERLTVAPDCNDRSGCVRRDARGLETCSPPYTVTHRIYWHTDDHDRKPVSAFLSYPNGMGSCDTYFWEAYTDDVHRYSTEEECEAAVRAHLTTLGNGNT